MIEIKHRYTGAILFSADVGSMRLCVEAALTARADLRCADLRYANLRYANLTSANLTSANLTSANLTYANLTHANLRCADLRCADLTSANLTSANLRCADLTRANLRCADLTYANLTRANLRCATGVSGVLTIGPIGSRADALLAILDESGGIRVTTGCFSGSLTEFEAAVQAIHGDSEHGQHYRLAIALIKAKLGGGV